MITTFMRISTGSRHSVGGAGASACPVQRMPEYERKLPHFLPADRYVFITWRLYGTLPRRREYERYPAAGHAFVAQDRALAADRIGPRWTKDPRIAAVVAQAIKSGATDYRLYELFAWVVMPNHVHILINPLVRVSRLMRWLKGSTARAANQLLGRTGMAFWQDESFDHYIRDQREFANVVNYIENNPVAAGLAASP